MKSIRKVWAALGIIALLMALVPSAAAAAPSELPLTFARSEAGTVTYYVPAGVASMSITVTGGGGGGGGRYHTTPGGNGGDGVTTTETIAVDSAWWDTVIQITVGAGGDGGLWGGQSGSGHPGDSGRSSSVTVGGNTYSAIGGVGGSGGTSGASHRASPLGADPAGSAGQGGLGGVVYPNSPEHGARGNDGQVTITSTLVQCTLTVVSAGTGSGTVEVNGSVYDPEACNTYVYGTVVTLAAIAADNSTFIGWTGAVGSAYSATVTLTDDTEVTATFGLNLCALTVTAGLGGSVQATGYGTVEAGETELFEVPCEDEVVLKAIPYRGYRFIEWIVCPPRQEFMVRGEGEGTCEDNCEHYSGTQLKLGMGDYCGVLIEGSLYAGPSVTAIFERIPEDAPSAVITVAVVKSDGGDVGGMLVSVSGPVGATLTTNASGVASLGGLYAGTYTVNASAIGYTSSGPETVVLPSSSGSGSATIVLTAAAQEPEQPQTPEEPPIEEPPIEEPEQPIVEPPVEPPAGEGEPTEPGDLPKTGASYLGTTLLGLALVAAGLGRRRSR